MTPQISFEHRIYDMLIAYPMTASELKCAMLIYREKAIWNRDLEMSYNNFSKVIGMSAQAVIAAMKRLQIQNIITLTVKGGVSGQSNTWRFNRKFKSWEKYTTQMARLCSQEVSVKNLYSPTAFSRWLNIKKKGRY